MTTKTTTTNNATRNEAQSAAEAFAAHQEDIARLVDVLQQELAFWAREQARSPRDWGYTGQAAHVRNGLIDLVEATTGRERAEIERFLAE